jgi:hypothetical protein
MVAAEGAGVVGAKAPQANKRAALGDVTNVGVEGGGRGRAGGSRKVSAAPAGSAASVRLCAPRLFPGYGFNELLSYRFWFGELLMILKCGYGCSSLFY